MDGRCPAPRCGTSPVGNQARIEDDDGLVDDVPQGSKPSPAAAAVDDEHCLAKGLSPGRHYLGFTALSWK